MNNKKSMKTILFASLLLAMILPFSSMDFAEADKGQNKDVKKDHHKDAKQDKKEKKHQEKLAQIKQKALHDNEIPESELLKRMGDKWISQYTSVEEFERTEKGMKSYVEGDYQNNGWNQAMVKSHKKIHNFETMIENTGKGHELVLLVAEKNSLKGKYNPSEPVKKFHEWLAPQYEIPTTISEINDRLLEIVGDQKMLKLAKKVAKQFNKMADHGNVPDTLIQTDPNYWMMVASISMCEYDVRCDVTTLTDKKSPLSDAEIAELEQREADEITPISTGLWQFILPEASAWSKQQVQYYLYTFVTASECTYDDCFRSYSNYFTGSGVIGTDSFTSGNEIVHTARGKTLSYYAVACDVYSGSQSVKSQVTVTPYLAMSLQTSMSTSDYNWNGCSLVNNTFQVDSPYIYGVQATSVGSYYWVN